ncbi:helix-turn-helix domain-containing protein [Streptacidiphilus sp. EB129]|uniref:helix-turn-helix domain-containing protein n=1 Tax=Streptacidiphilus sp. EB129 TaxID=3156262 RepID=UPI003511260C
MFADQTASSDAVGIGRRVREQRLARGLLQQDLATAEISASYISLIEGGKRTPSPSVLAALAERVGTTVEYLRTGRNEAELNDLRLELGFSEMALRNGSHGEALQSITHVLTKSAVLSPELLFRARFAQATALERLGRLESAISILHDLTKDRALVVGSAQWAEVNVSLCRCYTITGDLSMSVEVGERALQRLDSLGLEVTDDHIQLGVTLVGAYYLRSDFTRAHLLSERLLAQAEKTESRAARGMVYWNAGLIAESRGDRNEAVALVERALGFMAEGDNHRHLAMLKSLLGWLILRSESGDPAEAKSLLEQAVGMLVETGSVHEIGDSEVGLALADMRLGLLKEAQEHASRAVGILANENSGVAAEALATLGETQLLNGETVHGEASLRGAARQLRQLRRPDMAAARVYRYLGDVWNRHGNPDEAMRAYRDGLTASGAEGLPVTERAAYEAARAHDHAVDSR